MATDSQWQRKSSQEIPTASPYNRVELYSRPQSESSTTNGSNLLKPKLRERLTFRPNKSSMNGHSVETTAGGQGEKRFDARFKVLLLGDSGVGKTAILRSLLGEAFQYTTISTIGIDLAKKIFLVENNRIQLEIWDTAGQEQFYSIVSLHFREAKAFLVVYDVTSLESFEHIRKHWLHSVDQHMNEAIPIFFAANKTDLRERRCVTKAQGEELASKQCAYGIEETSAKTGENVQALFQKIAEAMVGTWGVPKRWYEQPNEYNSTQYWQSESSGNAQASRSSVFQLGPTDHKQKKSSSKCCLTH